MIQLSVVIITFNEEKNIGICLEAAKDVADELVVVDSFSTDKTAEICRKYNVKFVQHTFEGHIQQKNWALTQTSNDCVLSLDADEVLSPRLKASILEIKKNWTHDGYYFNRLTNYCGKWIRHGGWYPDRKLRLWDKRKGQWKGVNPHDRFELVKGATKKYIKGDLLHYSYFSIRGHIDQVNKFTGLGSKAAFEIGKKSNFLKITFAPFWKFVKDYIIRLGFLDGYYGYIIAMISAHASFIKYVKLKELWRKK